MIKANERNLLQTYHQIAADEDATPDEILKMLQTADLLKRRGWMWREKTDTWDKNEYDETVAENIRRTM